MKQADLLKATNRIYAAADLYYRSLHDVKYAIQRFRRECYWFDNAILRNYRGQCIHLDCFYSLYDWNVGIKHSLGILNDRRKRPWEQDSADELSINHLTINQNAVLADELFKLFVCKENDNDLYCK